MHFVSLAITALVTTASAVALPQPNPSTLLKRNEVQWDKKGNIKLTFSRETVNIGTLTLDKIFKDVVPICHESGQCETNPLIFSSQYMQSESSTELVVTVHPDGAYPTWIRNGLVDVLQASVASVAKCTSGKYTDRCFGSSAMAYCPQRTFPYTNCEVPKFWGINYQAPDAGNAAPPNVGLGLDVEKAGDGGLCEKAMSALGGLAGAVNGYAGGVFSLLSLACQ